MSLQSNPSSKRSNLAGIVTVSVFAMALAGAGYAAYFILPKLVTDPTAQGWGKGFVLVLGIVFALLLAASLFKKDRPSQPVATLVPRKSSEHAADESEDSARGGKGGQP